MRFVCWQKNGATGLAVRQGSELVVLGDGDMDLLGVLRDGFATNQVKPARALDQSGLTYLPPIAKPPKIICVGMNYKDHAQENKLDSQEHPTFFVRFASSLIGHEQPIIRPRVSEQLDYEGELAAIIGKPGRHIPKERALEHVAGYSIFNDASIRDYQMRGKQW